MVVGETALVKACECEVSNKYRISLPLNNNRLFKVSNTMSTFHVLAARSFMTLISIHSTDGVQSSHIRVIVTNRHEWLKEHSNMVTIYPLLKKIGYS